MATKREKEQEEYSSMINANSMLLAFEGWIKYIEGFTKCLSATDKVNSSIVLDCIGEILEYMGTLRGQLYNLLIHCEDVLEREEALTNGKEQIEQKFEKQAIAFETEKQRLEEKIKLLEQIVNEPKLEVLEELDGKDM